MEFYGNILTMYNHSDIQLESVKTMLNDKNFPFEIIENTFFFGTTSIKKSKDFQKELFLLPFDFTFFFLSNADGSTIQGKGIDNNILERIDSIFFDDI